MGRRGFARGNITRAVIFMAVENKGLRRVKIWG
jgi:hypothetical protein